MAGVRVTATAARRIYKRIGRRCEGAAWGRGVAAALAVAGALLAGGCSVTFPIGSLVGADDEPLTTGSIRPVDVSPLAADLAGEDWRRARSALAVAVDPQGNGSSVSWDNPESGARGAFVPTSQPFVKNDEICRGFIAHLSLPKEQRSLQGTACRPSGGEWAVRDVKPLKKPA